MGPWLVGGGLVVVLVAIAVSSWLGSSTPDVQVTFDVPPPPPVAPPPAVVARAPVRAAPVAPVTAAQPVAEPVAMAEEPPPPPVTGGATGMALYRPGIKPLKRGILVPEGFELPPGYMRHYQTTDQGEAVDAILMFHPDYQPLDGNGQPIPLPSNRVVPPEMAPPGLPIKMLELPASEGGE